jgi:hypothetical protein
MARPVHPVLRCRVFFRIVHSQFNPVPRCRAILCESHPISLHNGRCILAHSRLPHSRWWAALGLRAVRAAPLKPRLWSFLLTTVGA